MASNSVAAGDTFPVPLWATTLILLTVEFSFYALWVATTIAPKDGLSCALFMFIALVFIARLVVAIASYSMSRWKGSPIVEPDKLGFFGGCRFFAVEFGHLCIQNLVLIPFRVFFHTSNERTVTNTGRVLLLQHGYVNNGAVWFFTARALERMGYRVFTMDQPVFAPIDTMGARLGARVDEVLALTGECKVTLIAHSMGGLVCRAYLRQFGGAKVSQLITLGTPHHGTFHAYIARGTNGKQMRLGNSWLAALCEIKVAVPFTSIYSAHDTIIAPQVSSIMPEAANVKLVGIGHVSMPSGVHARHAIIKALDTV
jgi:triacylglycerol esterase/lipase EstA (alpha/beta hydrolase family)